MARSISTAIGAGLAGAVLAAALTGCGGASAGPTTAASTSSARDIADEDGDSRGQLHDRDDSVLRYGVPATPAQQRAIVAVVRAYDAAGAAADGARGCALIFRSLAVAEVATEVLHARPVPSLNRAQCARELSAIFARAHARFVPYATGVPVTQVRVGRSSATVLTRIPNGPQRQTPVLLVGGRWKIATVYDEGLP